MHMKDQKGKNNWVGVIIIALVVFGAFLFVQRSNSPKLADLASDLPPSDIADAPFFAADLASQGISADTIGFHNFSRDGKYFFFSAYKEGATPPNRAYLVALADSTIKTLPGFASRGFTDSRVLQLEGGGGVILYWPASGKQQSYATGEESYSGSLSPDAKKYAVNTGSGIKIIDIASGAVSALSTDRYDSAHAWFSDNARTLGFRGTDELIAEDAGMAREFGIWNVSTGAFTMIPTPIAIKTFRSAEWVIADKVARINAGWDDGSHDYLFNVQNNELIDLGDTSGALMGGMRIDAARGLFAVLGGDDASRVGSRAYLYKGMELVHDIVLAKGYMREQMQIVDEDTLVYIRKQWVESRQTSQQLVSLDFATGKETVLRELPPRAYAALSLSPDNATWVLSTDATFMLGKI